VSSWVISVCHIVSVPCNFQVSYIGQDCREIPEHLGRDCGHFAKRLDLSFNLLRYVTFTRLGSGLGGTYGLPDESQRFQLCVMVSFYLVQGPETRGIIPQKFVLHVIFQLVILFC
jgi:hypothetical protein